MADSFDLLETTGGDRPDDYVRDLVRRAGSSFLWGMRLLPPSRRRAMYGIYAFCRAVDDIADGTAEETRKYAQLEAWRQEVHMLFAGNPKHPIMRSLQEATSAFELPKEEFLAVIDGMEMDVRTPIRAPSREDFTLYCRRVAGSVGLLSVHAFGARDGVAQELAVIEGEALQITNILRDLKEDAARGRLYIPQEMLEQQGISDFDPASVLAHPEFATVYAALCAEARTRFVRARGLIRQVEGSALRPARLMLELYSRLLDRLEAVGWPNGEQRVRVPRHEKFLLILRFGLF
ncbi:presqualene diphosphate synthase HpnD [Pelagibius sp. Alg239-R121]|uniref:presqualene diphosphate synthase HpnD n=1 Tax=Pelagibius sp. Alg239-R121 TaxID=2993448 RepID=UPI0024A758A0|nr:presqualene diphosphate synthase HpnD [Pelagibius sp. Alg239-R121]